MVSRRTVVERRHGTAHIARTAPNRRGTSRTVPEHEGSRRAQPLALSLAAGACTHRQRDCQHRLVFSVLDRPQRPARQPAWTRPRQRPPHPSRPSTRLLATSQQDELAAALAAGSAPAGERRTGRPRHLKVCSCMSSRETGRLSACGPLVLV